MPNSVLANMAIDNYGMRNFRRFKTTLQIEYGTDVMLIESFIQKLRYQIQLNPKIEKNEVPVQIYINELGESSINVLLSIYFIADTAQVELEERHKLIIDIMSLAHETGIKFAYPSRTLFVKKEQEL
jgi:MscS family membrane protein